MRRTAAYAFRNLRRSKIRTLLLMGMGAAGISVMLLIAGGYQYIFNALGNESSAVNGDIRLDADNAEAALTWDAYRAVKEKLLSGGLVTAALAEAEISGLIGTADRSIPCNGTAFEGSFSNNGAAFEGGIIFERDGTFEGGGAENPVPASIGAALARSLGVSPGTLLSGFIADCGLTLEVERIIQTEAAIRDRFYIALPLEALLERGAETGVTSLRIWLARSLSAPGLSRDSDSPYYTKALALIREIPELEPFTLYSMKEGNTVNNKIVHVYRTNYRVIETVIMISLFLAFLNVLSLSMYERRQEFGTLRAMGTPVSHIRLLLITETLFIAAASWIAGALLSTILGLAVNAAGGAVFPPPPGRSDPLRVGIRLSAEKALFTGLTFVVSATGGALMGTLFLGKSGIVKQLYWLAVLLFFSLPSGFTFTVKKGKVLQFDQLIYRPVLLKYSHAAKAPRQRVNRKISLTLNPMRQRFVLCTGLPKPLVRAAAESSSPIFTADIRRGTIRYSGILRALPPPK